MEVKLSLIQRRLNLNTNLPILNSWGRGAWKVTIPAFTRVGHNLVTRNSKVAKQSERVLSSPASFLLLSTTLSLALAVLQLACPR